MERLGGRGFDDVVFSLEDERGGVSDVSMEVAVRVRFPLDEKVQAASLWLCAKDRQPVVDGVVKFGSTFDMRPRDVVKVEGGNWAG